MSREGRAAPAVAFALLLLAPAVAAQAGSAGTIVNPVEGAYNEVYVVAGRSVDARGNPMTGAPVIIELEQEGVRAAPLTAGTDCFGSFLTYFEIRHIDHRGKVKVTIKGREGAPDAVAEARLDPFYRRSDLNLSWTGEWNAICPEQTHLWANRVTITGRILNRTEPYKEGVTTYDAKPELSRVRLRYFQTPPRFECPPAEGGLCEPIVVDERGDFRYSWVFENATEASGWVEVLAGNKSYNFTVDPKLRVAVARIELSGRGPPIYESAAPFPALYLSLALVASLALALRRRR